ncbi:MAG: hypothetical protein AABX16_04080 [Nanoarchaeota archaeon]
MFETLLKKSWGKEHEIFEGENNVSEKRKNMKMGREMKNEYKK